MMGDDGLAPRGEWWVGVMGRVVSFGELCPAQPANMRRWGSLRGSIPSLVNSLAASKTLWGQSMLVTWIDCVGVELRDVECAQRSCSAVDSQMRGFAGESEGRAYGYGEIRSWIYWYCTRAVMTFAWSIGMCDVAPRCNMWGWSRSLNAFRGSKIP